MADEAKKAKDLEISLTEVYSAVTEISEKLTRLEQRLLCDCCAKCSQSVACQCATHPACCAQAQTLCAPSLAPPVCYAQAQTAPSLQCCLCAQAQTAFSVAQCCLCAQAQTVPPPRWVCYQCAQGQTLPTSGCYGPTLQCCCAQGQTAAPVGWTQAQTQPITWATFCCIHAQPQTLPMPTMVGCLCQPCVPCGTP